MDNVTFLNLIRVVAEKHGCTISHIDFDTHTVFIDGPDDNQVACAVELSEILEVTDNAKGV